MNQYYYFYDEANGSFHKWLEKTTIRKAIFYAEQLNAEADENDKIDISNMSITKAIEILELVNIVEGRKEDYM